MKGGHEGGCCSGSAILYIKAEFLHKLKADDFIFVK